MGISLASLEMTNSIIPLLKLVGLDHKEWIIPSTSRLNLKRTNIEQIRENMKPLEEHPSIDSLIRIT